MAQLDERQTDNQVVAGSIGVILELSEREKFCNNFRISGRSFGPNFGFSYTFYTFAFLLQLKIGKVSQQGDFFSQIAR